MRNDIRSGNATLEFHAGTDLAGACLQAVMLANDIHGPVNFRFNGVDLSALPCDTPSGLMRRWDSRIEYEAMARKLSQPESQGEKS